MSSSASEVAPVVLVVDDEPLLRLVAVDFLADAGFATIEAENASEALKIMKSRGDVDVLFSDIQMPGSIDGMGLAHEVDRRWPNVLLLMTSGNAWPSKAAIPGHGRFLAKPYRPDAVIREIRALLREAAARHATPPSAVRAVRR